MSNLTNIFKENQKCYSHLIFGEDRPDIRDSYSISKEEEILVFAPVESIFHDAKSGVVITDRGVYPYQSNQDSIPLGRICEVVFYQDNPNGAIMAFSQKGEFVLFPKQSRQGGKTGRELLQLLWAFQTNLMTVTPSMRRQREVVLGHLLSFVRKSFHEFGILEEKAEILLEMIASSDTYRNEVTFVRGENLYRKGDRGQYQRFLDGLKTQDVSEEVQRKLQHPEEVFFSSYVQDISNPYLLYMTQQLIAPYSVLRQKPYLTEQEAVILSYLCVRMDDSLYLHKLLNDYGRKMGEKQIWEIMCFEAKYKNEKMCSVYNHIVSDEPVGISELRWTDSLYLTPLHYALLLRNAKAVYSLLEMQDWSQYQGPDLQDEKIEKLYEIHFVASILYENPYFLRQIFLATSKVGRSMARSIHQLEQKMYINEKLGNKTLARKYAITKSELERELESLLQTTVMENRRYAMEIFSCGDPYAKYLMTIYENNDSLFHILTGTISDWRLYRIDQHFFVTNIERQLPHSYYEWRNQQIVHKHVRLEDVLYQWTDAEETEFEKLYGKKEEKKRTYHKYTDQEMDFDVSFVSPYAGGFFSQEAHEDLGIMKKEYRALVKQYHPDNGKSGSVKIFQQIMTERANIIENLK